MAQLVASSAMQRSIDRNIDWPVAEFAMNFVGHIDWHETDKKDSSA